MGDLEDIMLSVITQAQKEQYCMISLHVESKHGELIEAKSRM
jgi:hypothetical protein